MMFHHLVPAALAAGSHRPTTWMCPFVRYYAYLWDFIGRQMCTGFAKSAKFSASIITSITTRLTVGHIVDAIMDDILGLTSVVSRINS